MNITVTDLYNLNQGLADLLEKELSTAAAFKVQKNYQAVTDEIKPSEEVRKKIINKYKDQELEDGQVTIKAADQADFNKEIDELMQQEVDIEMKTLKLSHLGDSVKPKTLLLLEKIIEEDE